LHQTFVVTSVPQKIAVVLPVMTQKILQQSKSHDEIKELNKSQNIIKFHLNVKDATDVIARCNPKKVEILHTNEHYEEAFFDFGGNLFMGDNICVKAKNTKHLVVKT